MKPTILGPLLGIVVLGVMTCHAQQNQVSNGVRTYETGPLTEKDYRAAIPEGAQIFRREKGEAADMPDAADMMTSIGRPVRLRTILDDQESALPGKLHDRSHLTGPARMMNDDRGASLWPDLGGNGLKDRFHRRPGLGRPAGHDAGAMARPLLTAGNARPDEVDPPGGEGRDPSFGVGEE